MNKKNNNFVLLQNLKVFEDVLSSFTVTAPIDINGWLNFEVKSEIAVETNANIFSQTTWKIWYRDFQTISITSIRKKVMSLLSDNNHIASDQICDILLVAIALFSNSKVSAVDKINSILTRICEVELSQFFSFKHRLPISNRTTFGELEIGNFTIGAFPTELVEGRCARAGSDYAMKYRAEFSKYTLAVYNERVVRIIDWFDCLKELNIDINKRIYSLVDSYFFHMSQIYFETFFLDLKSIQEVPQAFGSGWFDVEAMTKIFDTSKLSIFLNIGINNRGWVSPGINGQVNIDLGGFYLGLPYVFNQLKKQYSGWNKSTELYSSIKLYCSYLAKASICEYTCNTSEALLNYVIALDLLLGEKGSSTDSFSTRCSALTYNVLGRKYLDLVGECKEVYDARSKYVHQGKIPDSRLISVIQPISREIAVCLFRLSRCENDEGFHKRWIANIDLLIAKINAEQQLITDDFRNAGIGLFGEYSYLNILEGLSTPQFMEGNLLN